MSEASGKELTNQTRSHKSLSMRLTPFKNKRPIFNTSRFASSPRPSTSKRSRLNELSEEGAETPKPIHLWSSPIVEKSSSQSSLNRRAKRLELSTLDDNSQEDKNGWISEKGKFHSWTESFSQFDRRNRITTQKTKESKEKKTNKNQDWPNKIRYTTKFHSWTEAFSQFDRRNRIPTQKTKESKEKKTNKNQDWPNLGRYELTKAERELLAELKKTTDKAVFGSGWKRMTFDEFKKSAPPRRERGNAADPRPYSWRKKTTTTTATASVQTETASTVTTNTNTVETITQDTQESRGGGKVKAKKNRAHESRKKNDDDDIIVQPSYSLDNIAPIIMNPILPITPMEIPKIETPKEEKKSEFSQPRQKSASSQAKDIANEVNFSFSQPKGLNKLNLDSQKKDEPKDESKKEETKLDTPLAPPLTSGFSGFGDLIAKQKKDCWVCDICMTSNKIDALKCIACEEPNPNAPKAAKSASAAVSEPPKFSFGVKSDAPPPNITAPTNDTGFGGFGSSSKKDSPKSEAPKFSFGGAPAEPEKKKEETPPLAPISNGFGDLIAKQKKDCWVCDICMTSNKFDALKCIACEEPNPNAPKTEAPKAPPQFAFGVAAPPSVPASSGFGDLIAKQKKDCWICDICMTSNKIDAPKCIACEEPNPNAPKPAVGSSASAAAAEPPKFTFGVAAKSDSAPKAPSFGFGAPKTEEDKKDAPKPTFSFGVTPATTTTTESKPAENKPTFSLGAPKTEEKKEETKPTFSFAPTPTEAKPSFSFGAPAKAPEEQAKPVENKPSFSFGASVSTPATTTVPAPAEPAKPSFSFGASAPAPTTSAPSFLFGGTAPKPVEEKKEAPSFSFGGGAKKRPAPGAATPSTEPPKFSFANGGAPKTETPAFSFNAKSEAPKTGMFGATAAPTTTPAPCFSFGGAASKPAEPAKPSFSFGGAAQPPPAAAASTTEQSMFSPQMGQQKAAPSFSFGGAPAAAPPVQNSNQNNSGFNFGAASTKPSMFQPSAPSGSIFGDKQNAAPSFSFGGNSTTNSNEPFKFGESAPSQPQQSSGMFGGSQPNNGGSIFGAEQPKPAFGQTISQPAQPSFSFGAQPAAPTFGASQPNTNNGFGAQSQPNMFAASQSASQPSQGTPGGQGRRIARARRRNQKK